MTSEYKRYLKLKDDFQDYIDEAYHWSQKHENFVRRLETDISVQELNQWYHDNLEEFTRLQLKYVMYKPSTGIKRHLITFTRNPNSNYSVEQFKQSCEHQIARNLFACVKYTSEHHDTNIHYHAWVTTKYSITIKRFEAHSKKHGTVNVQPPGTDNGIDSYFSKENEIIYLVDSQKATRAQYENKNLAPY